MRSVHRRRGQHDDHHVHSKPDAGAAGCVAGWAATRLPLLQALRASSWHLPEHQHIRRSRHRLSPRRQLEPWHRQAHATGSPPIAIDAKCQSNHCGMPRGFLPWGLSNTCPQGGAMRTSVACDGQVSDNPKQKRSAVLGTPLLSFRSQIVLIESAAGTDCRSAIGVHPSKNGQSPPSAFRQQVAALRTRPTRAPSVGRLSSSAECLFHQGFQHFMLGGAHPKRGAQ